MSAADRDTTPAHGDSVVIVIVAHLFFSLGVLIAYLWVRPLAGLTDAALIYPASVVLLALFGWLLWSWKRLTGSIFDPYGLFLIAATLFNAGVAFLFVFHANTTGIMILDFSFTPDVTLQTLLLIFVGLAAFHCGGLLLAGVRDRPLFPGSIARATGSPSMEQIRVVGWGFLAISALPTALLLKQAVGVVLTSGYFGLFQQEDTTGLQAGTQFLGSFLVPGALVLLAGSKMSRAGRLTSMGVIAVYALVQLFLGARYHAIGPVIAYVWLWHRVIRPIPRWLLLGAAGFVFIVVFPVIAATRDTSGADRLSAQVFLSAFSSVNNPFAAILTETGGTMITIAHTLTLVPSVRGYDLGAQYGYAASTLVPNLFWSIHPAIAHGFASDWLVWLVDPSFAAQGGGFGFSFIAEAYLNWGWVGTPLFLGVVGFLIAALIYWGCSTGEPAKLAVVACFSSFVVFWARGEAIAVVRPLVWYSLMPYLLILLVAYLDRRGYRPLDVLRRLRRESEHPA